MMLSVALCKMMYKTECIMFYNTPNSISVVDDLESIKDMQKRDRVTISPWIYQELALSSFIEPQIPQRLQKQLIQLMEHSGEQNHVELDIQHDVSGYLTKMHRLGRNELRWWKNAYCIGNDKYSLDVLYQKYSNGSMG